MNVKVFYAKIQIIKNTQKRFHFFVCASRTKAINRQRYKKSRTSVLIDSECGAINRLINDAATIEFDKSIHVMPTVSSRDFSFN